MKDQPKLQPPIESWQDAARWLEEHYPERWGDPTKRSGSDPAPASDKVKHDRRKHP